MSFWKGYVPVRGKRALMAFKDKESSDLLTLEEAQKYPEYGGVLEENTAMIDIDNMEQASVLLGVVKELELNCKVIGTGRGMHFLFWNNGQIDKNRTHCKLAIGLQADIKLGTRCSYEVLKRDGVQREVLYDSEQYDTVPKYLTPVNTNIELFGLEGGEGRNQALFSYILPLQKAGFSVDQVRNTLRLINRFLFSEPLEDSELDVIMRDGAFTRQTFFDDKGKFLHDQFARWMVNNKHIIKIDGVLHVYRDGIYVGGDEPLYTTMIEELPTLKKAQRQEVYDYLKYIGVRNYKHSDTHFVAFQNGVLNLADNTFGGFTPERIITNKIPHNYHPSAKSELLENTINKLACGEQSVINLLYESMGYSLLRVNEMRKSFFLLGQKRNGKSTYLDMLQTMLGDDNVSNLDLCDLSSEFKTAEIMGKLANIGDDINDEYISNTAIFKKAVSGEPMTVNRKYEKPITMASRAKFYFSANALPRLGRGKDSAAIIDRLVIIPFNATFSKADPDYDPFIKYKLREEEVIEALIVKCVAALREVMANQEFTHCDLVDAEVVEFEKINNPILMFFDEHEPEEFMNESTASVYRNYCNYCYTNNMSPLSNIEFGKQIRKHFGLEVKQRRIDGKKIRIYVKI